MINIKKLIKDLKKDGNNVVINIFESSSSSPVVEAPSPVVEAPAPVVLPATDFKVGDKVFVCHIAKDGNTKHTRGEVIEVQRKDEDGWYTRILGDNGKHYRTGLKVDEARKNSKVVYIL